jgi:hypothetical protein
MPAVDAIVRACYVADDDLVGLRDRFLGALRRVVPVDAAFVAIETPRRCCSRTRGRKSRSCPPPRRS